MLVFCTLDFVVRVLGLRRGLCSAMNCLCGLLWFSWVWCWFGLVRFCFTGSLFCYVDMTCWFW